MKWIKSLLRGQRGDDTLLRSVVAMIGRLIAMQAQILEQGKTIMSGIEDLRAAELANAAAITGAVNEINALVARIGELATANDDTSSASICALDASLSVVSTRFSLTG